MHLGLLPNLSACMIGMLLEPPIVAITHYVMWFSSRLNWNLHSASRTINRMALLLHRAVQWHYIDELSNDTVPNHTFIYNQSPSSIYLQSNYNYGMISGAFAQKCASARLAQCHWTALWCDMLTIVIYIGVSVQLPVATIGHYSYCGNFNSCLLMSASLTANCSTSHPLNLIELLVSTRTITLSYFCHFHILHGVVHICFSIPTRRTRPDLWLKFRVLSNTITTY